MAIQAALLMAQAAGGGLSALSSLEAGKIEEAALEFSAEQETINARLRQKERLERLVNSMAANNAALGGRGIAMQGSPLNILKADFQKASKEAQADLLDARSIELSLRSRAKAARLNSQIQALGTLFGTGADIVETGV